MCTESAVNSMTCLFQFWTANSAFQHNYKRTHKPTDAVCACFVSYTFRYLCVYTCCIHAWVYQLTFYFVCVSFSSFAFLENITWFRLHDMMMFGFKIVTKQTKNEFVHHFEFIYSSRSKFVYALVPVFCLWSNNNNIRINGEVETSIS